MKRPAGVIVTAVLLFLGTAICLGWMALVYLSVQLLKNQPEMAQAEMPAFVLYSMLGFYLLSGAWAAVTGIGLLRLKNWARISLLLIAGTTVLVAASSAVPLWFFLTPEASGGNLEIWQAVRIGMVLVFAIPAAIGVWWLIYFTRTGVRSVFAGGVREDAGIAQRPLSMTLLGWFLVTSAPLAIVGAPLGWPAWAFGAVLRGWSAAAVYLMWGIVGTIAGYGLLRLKPWGYTLTLVYFLAGTVNGLLLYTLPNAFEEMTEVSREILHLPAPKALVQHPPMWIYMLLTLIGFAVLFYFLISRRKRFLDAAATARLKTN